MPYRIVRITRALTLGAVMVVVLAACSGGQEVTAPELVVVGRPTQAASSPGAPAEATPSITPPAQGAPPADVPLMTVQAIPLGSGTLEGAVWSPDEQWLALNGSFGVWRWAANPPGADPFAAEPEVIIPEGTVLAFSADGSRALVRVGGEAPALVVWDAAARATRATLAESAAEVRRVALNADGSRAALIVVPAESEEAESTLDADLVLLGPGAADIMPEGSLLRVVDTATGATLSESPLPDSRVMGMAYTAGGALLLAGSAQNIPALNVNKIGTETLTYPGNPDFDVRVWEAGPGEDWPAAPRATITGLEGPATNVVFSADGSRLAGAVMSYVQGTYSTTTNGEVKVWDALTGELLLAPAVKSDAPVTTLALSADGTRLAAVSEEYLSTEDSMLRRTGSAIEIWNMASASLDVRVADDALRNATGGLLAGLAFSPDGSRLAAVTSDSAWVWDAASGAAAGRVNHFTSGITTAAYSLDGATIYTGDLGGMIRSWDGASGEPLRQMPTYGGGVDNLRALPDGTFLYNDLFRGRIAMFNPETGESVAAYMLETLAEMSFSPDGTLMAGSTGGGTILLVNLLTGERMGAILAGHQVGVLTFAPDNQGLFSGGLDGSIYYWDLDDLREPAAVLSGHTGAITGLWWADGEVLISGSLYPVQITLGYGGDQETSPSDGTLRRWDLSDLAAGNARSEVMALSLPPATEDDLQRLRIQGQDLASLSGWLSPDAALMAVAAQSEPGGVSDTLLLYDTATGAVTARLEELREPVVAVAWSPDGRSLVASGAYGGVMLWQLGE